MQIRTSTGMAPGRTAVMLLKEKGRFGAHPSFRVLAKADREHLAALEKSVRITADFARLALLPSKKQLLILGAPERQKFTLRKAILAMRKVISASRKERLAAIEVRLEDFLPERGTRALPELAELLAAQCELANFEFNEYKEPPKNGWSFVKQMDVIVQGPRAKVEAALRRGKIIGEEINRARRLANTPGGDMTPRVLAREAIRVGKYAGFKTKVIDEKGIRALKMGGIVGVSQGSNERPKFIVMEYMRGKQSEKPVVLVGKGVTFDTGGLNLKPSQFIYEMHMDMSGGAAVIHALGALARLKVKKNIVGLVPAVENMPSGSSYRPGDVLKTMSGKTIEVLDTDAEGRIILADALTYAKRYNPDLIIDIATLTGAAAVALGERASAIFATDEKLSRALCEAGEKSGDYAWPLPLWEEYESEIKGTFGDVANTGNTKYGGAITGAVFLWQFVKNDPSTGSRRHQGSGGQAGQVPRWAHIDIAPRMTSIEGEYLAKGAAGASIALLTRFLENF